MQEQDGELKVEKQGSQDAFNNSVNSDMNPNVASRRYLDSEAESPTTKGSAQKGSLSVTRELSSPGLRSLQSPGLERSMSLKRQMSLVREQRGVGYLIYAFLAALLMAFSGFLRSLAAAKPYDSLFAYSLGMLVCASLLLALMKCILKEKFRMPYYQKQTTAANTTSSEVDKTEEKFGQKATKGEQAEGAAQWKFGWCNFVLVILAGLAELSVSLSIIITFSYANEYGINAGIATVLLPTSSAFAAIIAYFAFEEHMQKIQFLGMLIILCGASFIAIFPAKVDDGEQATPGEIATVLSINLVSALLFTGELMISRILGDRGADGRLTGFSLLFAMGLVGSVCLIASTAMGNGIHAIGWDVFGILMLSALCAAISLGLASYAMTLGVASLVVSVMNLMPALMCVIAIFAGQDISTMQGFGLVISVIGTITLSLKDNCASRMRERCSKGKQDNTI